MVKIDCKKYADEIINDVFSHMATKDFKKSLVIFTAGDDPASKAYVKGKIHDCGMCGIPVKHICVENQDELLTGIWVANVRDDVGGIIVQLPLPMGFNEELCVNSVLITKDVDGFKEGSPFLPCTPEGIMFILKKELGDISGKKALVVGRGKLVGSPVTNLLLKEGCTVCVAHSKTRSVDLHYLIQHSDIIVSGVGKPNLIDLKECKAEIVIDAGISRDKNGKLCGDCFNFDANDDSTMKVTTVPNGIGLMTRAMLMKHMGEVNGR